MNGPMNGPQTTSISLMARLGDAGQNEAAWNEFLRIYGPHVIQWCRGHGLRDSDAQDISQEVLLRFWRRAASFHYDPSQTLRGYLRRMVLSAVSEWAEQARRGGRVGGKEPLDALLENIPAREDLAARLERAYDTELLAIAMREVEERVQPHTWEAFRLLAMEGRSGMEVAERLGMQVNTAYVARTKVQRMIREVMAKLDTQSETPTTEAAR